MTEPTTEAIEAFLEERCTEVYEMPLSDLELKMDNHKCYTWKGIEYFVPEDFLSEEENQIVEYLQSRQTQTMSNPTDKQITRLINQTKKFKNSLVREQTRLQKENDSAKSVIVTSREKIKDLKREMTQAEATISALQAKQAENQQRLEEIQKELLELQADLEDVDVNPS